MYRYFLLILAFMMYLYPMEKVEHTVQTTSAPEQFAQFLTRYISPSPEYLRRFKETKIYISMKIEEQLVTDKEVSKEELKELADKLFDEFLSCLESLATGLPRAEELPLDQANWVSLVHHWLYNHRSDFSDQAITSFFKRLATTHAGTTLVVSNEEFVQSATSLVQLLRDSKPSQTLDYRLQDKNISSLAMLFLDLLCMNCFLTQEKEVDPEHNPLALFWLSIVALTRLPQETLTELTDLLGAVKAERMLLEAFEDHFLENPRYFTPFLLPFDVFVRQKIATLQLPRMAEESKKHSNKLNKYTQQMHEAKRNVEKELRKITRPSTPDPIERYIAFGVMGSILVLPPTVLYYLYKKVTERIDRTSSEFRTGMYIGKKLVKLFEKAAEEFDSTTLENSIEDIFKDYSIFSTEYDLYTSSEWRLKHKTTYTAIQEEYDQLTLEKAYAQYATPSHVQQQITALLKSTKERIRAAEKKSQGTIVGQFRNTLISGLSALFEIAFTT